jgi:5-methylcytosine-specific restriction endonuclease McrA
VVALTESVLVLNRLWQAVNVCTVKRAVGLLYQGYAQVVFEDDGQLLTYSFHDWRDFSLETGEDGTEYLHTVSFRLLVPKIILLHSYDKLPIKDVKFTRYNIFERDRNRCQYCGHVFERRDLNLDHVIPKDQGGHTTWTNIVCSCKQCNTHKGNRTPRQAGMRLVRRPKKPTWNPFVTMTVPGPPHATWRKFIDLAYWHVELGQD